MSSFFKHRAPIRFTRFGGYYVFFSLAVGAAAINTGNNLLYLILGLLLGFIIISGFLSDSCMWGTRAELQPVGDFYVGQPAEWELIVRKGWFPGVIVEVELLWKQPPSTRQVFYWIPRHGQAQQRITATPRNRGKFALEAVRYATRFPFGLFEKSHRVLSGESWTVFPGIKDLPLNMLRAAGLNLSDQPSARKGWGVTPFDIREYQEGDSSKRIHWKSTAKRGQLMISEMEEESGSSQMLYVSRWPEGSVELFISFVASLVYALWKHGERVGLTTPDATFEPDASRAQLKRILTYLALIDPATRPPAVPGSRERSPHAVDVHAVWEQLRHRL